MNWEQWEHNAFTAQPNEFSTPNRSHLRREGSKVDKILGTTALEIQQHDHNLREEKKRVRRPNFLRTPEIISRKPSTFVPFPTPSPEETQPSQSLRVRASSPLLGHQYPQEPSPRSTRRPWKKLHQPGSSSTLYSHFNPRDSTIDPEPRPETAPNDDVSNAGSFVETQSKAGQSIRFKEPKSPAKESKRKIRPPRIDLSLLFPKPRSSGAPLLSPQRMMNSPSQLSFASEAPSANTRMPDGRKLPTAQFVSATARRPSTQAPSVSSEKENSTRFENSLQRTVRTSEFDLALDKYDELQRKQSKSTDKTVRRMTSNSSAGGWSKDMYLTPDRSSRLPNRVSHSSGGWPGAGRGRSVSDKRPISKKSSKSTLQNSDLNTSSVLCLSSSEDEGDDDEEPIKPPVNKKNIPRDSVMSYDEFEPEICTASAAHATKGQSLRRVDVNIPAGQRPQNVLRNQSVHRHPSMSSYATRQSHSRKSSGAPTSNGSEIHPSDRFMGTQYLSPRELSRRSRVMAVTRQEEHLLEAMRQRKGKITPSIYHEARSTGTDAEQMSMLSVPSRDSFYSGDTSFLRLSTGPPPLRLDQSTGQSDKEGPSSQGTSSDTERKTINSTTSPRASLAYTESLPSPTSGASPLTPTLPIHRFSPLPSQKPPPRHPPPAVPQEQRRHSRRRTDSSEAIVLDEADEDKEDEFPIWAYGLDNPSSLAAAVH